MKTKLLVIVFIIMHCIQIKAQFCENYRSPFRASYENPFEYSKYGYDVYSRDYVQSFAYTYALIPYIEVMPYAPGSYYYAFR